MFRKKQLITDAQLKSSTNQMARYRDAYKTEVPIVKWPSLFSW